MNARTRRGGYTLIEVLGYGTVLLVIMNMSASILIGTKRLHTIGTIAIERNEALEDVGRDFREAVHASTTSSEKTAGLPESPSSLVLSAPTTKDTAHYFLWRHDDTGRLYLEQYETKSSQKFSLVSRKIYPPCLKVLALSVTRAPAAGVVDLVIVIDNEATPRTVPRSNHFIAALGTP